MKTLSKKAPPSKKAKIFTQHVDAYSTVIEDNIYNAHLERPSLLAMLPELNNKTVLDLGCGPGTYSEYLLEQGTRLMLILKI